MTFQDFPLSDSTMKGIEAAGFDAPLPIQSEAIPALLEGGDVVMCAQTGTGKTAAFLIPMIESLQEMAKARRFRPRALVLSPTRELAAQVAAHFAPLASATKLRYIHIYGGVPIAEQERALQDGVELIVATPGRLLDHLRRGELKLADVGICVIDEADRLFDGGFLDELREIVDALPLRRQTVLVSATMALEVENFARTVLNKPRRIQVGAVAPRDSIAETFWPVPEQQKADLLAEILAKETDLKSAIVFVRQKTKAAEIAPLLAAKTGMTTADLHADLTQQQRDETVRRFREGEVRLLVATDVASRGLDFEGVTHVVNFDVPNTPDDYIHRVGRTGRVHRAGVAHTLVSPRELALATAIEENLRIKPPYQRIDGFAYDAAPDLADVLKPRRNRKPRGFHERTPSGGKDSPFTRSGQLKPHLRDASEEEAPRRASKKRAERRLLGKKLPHKRKK